MAQLNVAREPSMDEILASIRKIIESNEPGPAGTSARQTFEDDAGDDIELSIDSEIEADAFGSVEDQFSPVRTSPSAIDTRSNAPVSPSAPLSLADVAARVRAASERQAVHTVPRDQAGSEEARSPADSPAMMSRIAAFPSSAIPASAAANAESAPAAGDVPAAAHATASDEATAPESTPGTIVSPAVSRQVARAFDELAHAVENGPRRSFDEIAEAMLRPMLQEWLDDNLPTLVERLVREEIERVARGPRR
jgi:cell pole-organizing protein PopZ